MILNYKKPFSSNQFSFNSYQNNSVTIDKEMILEAINYTHSVLDKFTQFEVDVFEILGMRNLSSFIGEVFAASLIKFSKELFKKNPHQDGYPDLLLMDLEGIKLWKDLETRTREKQPFSPFLNGGIEIKATCGDVPSPEECERLNISKPIIGDQRIDMITGYQWKAHHRNTNNLMGILWDFINGTPRIIAVFFGNNLNIDDWGKISQPKENGGNTTSLSVMKKAGVKKMYDGCIYVLEDSRYINFINRYNRAYLL